MQKVENSNPIAIKADDYYVLDEWNSGLKRSSKKMADSVIKSPAFLFSAAIWSYLVLSWPGLSYVWKAKYKTIGHV